MKTWHWGALAVVAVGGYFWYQNKEEEEDEIIGGEVDLVEEVSPEEDIAVVEEEVY